MVLRWTVRTSSFALVLLCVVTWTFCSVGVGGNPSESFSIGTDEEQGGDDETTTVMSTTPSDYDRFVDSVKHQETDGRKIVATCLRKVLPVMVRMGHESGISSSCQMTYFKVMMALRELKVWALKRESFLSFPVCARPLTLS